MYNRSTVKSHHYSQHSAGLRAELGAAITRDQMRDFHRKQPWRHFAVTIRQFGILALATWGLIKYDNPLIWIPLAFVHPAISGALYVAVAAMWLIPDRRIEARIQQA